MIKSKKLVSIFVLAMLVGAPLCAQDALITFYMHGSQLKSGMPGTSTGLYGGPIYDGAERLFTFRTGPFLHNDRFITLRFPSGPHTFGTHDGKRPDPERSVALTLEPGQHYYMSATSVSKGIVVVEVERGLLQLVACNVAHTAAANAKPIELKRISQNIASRIVPESTFPDCS